MLCVSNVFQTYSTRYPMLEFIIAIDSTLSSYHTYHELNNLKDNALAYVHTKTLKN